MDYIKALEEERKKILVFERELPLSLHLITEAIETCKKQQLEFVVRSEEISSEEPILEEFIPLRPSYSSSDEVNNCKNGENSDGPDKKPNWLRSVQLWNQQPESKGDVVTKPIAVNAKRIGGAFHPFEKEKVIKAPVAEAPESSTTENTNGGCGSGGPEEEKEKKKEKEKEQEKEKEGNSQRKTRRSWSPELHRRFLHALQQLGGSHATPKQIRELMKVDGLTNDEVKSHLQKYRLHTRRMPSTPAVHSSGNSSPQQPQIVLVGGIWVPPPEYTAAAAAAAAAGAAQPALDTNAPLNPVYAPVASLPSALSKQKTGRSPPGPLTSERRCKGDDNMSEDAERTSDSSTTSSSSQTTTASPPC